MTIEIQKEENPFLKWKWGLYVKRWEISILDGKFSKSDNYIVSTITRFKSEEEAKKDLKDYEEDYKNSGLWVENLNLDYNLDNPSIKIIVPAEKPTLNEMFIREISTEEIEEMYRIYCRIRFLIEK